MLVLGRSEVESLIEPGALIDALGVALSDVSAGRASMPARIAARVAERASLLGAMVAYVPSLQIIGAKLVSVFPGNAGGPLPTHQAVIAVFDPQTGSPVALLDGTSITALRTAAGSALATRLLARLDASVLAIVGTGVQAASHAAIVPLVRSFREVRVAGRDPKRAKEFASSIEGRVQLPVRPCESTAEALAGADVVCATTHTVEPAVRGEWLSPGAHVNSVGLNPEGRELDTNVFRGALVAVESRAAAFAPFPSGANELRTALQKGALASLDDAVELGELVAGTKRGRSDREQRTVYKSVGIAAEDAAAAALVLRAAREKNIGREIDL
jgi:ornithine cyclodeaminase